MAKNNGHNPCKVLLEENGAQYNTDLHLAAPGNDTGTVKARVLSDSERSPRLDDLGSTVRIGTTKLARGLPGPAPSLAKEKDKYSETARHIAARNSHTATPVMRDIATSRVKVEEGWTALDLDSNYGHYSAWEVLPQNRARYNTESPLAANNNRSERLKFYQSTGRLHGMDDDSFRFRNVDRLPSNNYIFTSDESDEDVSETASFEKPIKLNKRTFAATAPAGAVVNRERLKRPDSANAIEKLYESANQLLTENINLLGEINFIFKTSKELQPRLEQYDLATLNSIIKILKEEQTKLKEKEIVVVVVGTTSSGKSTFINALIGQELLPSNNGAKTAIPIQIKHDPAQFLPKLRFNNPKPLEDLRKNVKAKTDYDCESRKKLKELKDDYEKGVKNGYSGFNKILNGEAVHSPVGAKEIYKYLKILNDFVRLAGKVIGKSPLAGFEERSQFPMIEVNFSSLRNLPKENGNFILMDSPGPNEAGGEHIMGFVNELMATASAVFPVINLSQQGTAHEARIIKAIKECLESNDNSVSNISVILNKKDAISREEEVDDEDSGDEGPRRRLTDAERTERTKTKQAKKLNVDKDCIFPISASDALLAKRAMNYLEKQVHLGKLEKLPDPGEESWVEDFGRRAFPPNSWENDIKNTDAVKKEIRYMLERSYFDRVVKDIERKNSKIQFQFSIVKSAFEKMIESTDKTHKLSVDKINKLQDRIISGLEKDKSHLKSEISSIKEKYFKAIESNKKAEARYKEIKCNTEKKLFENIFDQHTFITFFSQVSGDIEKIQKEWISLQKRLHEPQGFVEASLIFGGLKNIELKNKELRYGILDLYIRSFRSIYEAKLFELSKNELTDLMSAVEDCHHQNDTTMRAINPDRFGYVIVECPIFFYKSFTRRIENDIKTEIKNKISEITEQNIFIQSGNIQLTT